MENRTGDRNSQGQMDGGVEKGKGISPSEDRTDLVAAVITHPHTHRERQRERERERRRARTYSQAGTSIPRERSRGQKPQTITHIHTEWYLGERSEKKRETER